MSEQKNVTITIACEDHDVIACLPEHEIRGELCVTMTCDGEAVINVRERYDAHCSVPETIWNGRVYQACANVGQGVIDIDVLQALADEIRPLLERIHAGHSIGLDRRQSNMVGHYTDDAMDADAELTYLLERRRPDQLCYRSDWHIWDASEYLFNSMPPLYYADLYGIEGWPHDIGALAEHICREARKEKIELGLVYEAIAEIVEARADEERDIERWIDEDDNAERAELVGDIVWGALKGWSQARDRQPPASVEDCQRLGRRAAYWRDQEDTLPMDRAHSANPITDDPVDDAARAALDYLGYRVVGGDLGMRDCVIRHKSEISAAA